MRQITLTLFLSIIALTTYSQENYNSEAYRVTLGDIEANTFKKDSTANALVIYESGNSHVDKNEYDLRTEEKHKIKILNREGFDNANVVIHLYNNKNRKEKIKNILATTYNLIDGQVIKTQLQEVTPQLEEDITDVFWADGKRLETELNNTYANIKLVVDHFNS